MEFLLIYRRVMRILMCTVKFADALGILGIRVIDDNSEQMKQADLQEFLRQSLSCEE